MRGREAIVLDFRPRADFRPADELQKPYARLAGRLWLDAAERAVVRLEAWPTDAPAPPNAEPSIVFEHERLPDGVWLERLLRIKTYGHEDVFNGLELDFTRESSAFQRFSTKSGSETLNPPRKKP